MVGLSSLHVEASMSAFHPLRTFDTVSYVSPMQRRYGYSWALFFIASAAVAFLVGNGWLQRVLIFMVVSVPITIWAARRIRSSG